MTVEVLDKPDVPTAEAEAVLQGVSLNQTADILPALLNEDLVAAGVRFTSIGLTLPKGLPHGDWEALGKLFPIMEDAARWALGDWLVYGEMEYGSRYAKAAKATGYEESTLIQIAYVARAYDPLRRRNFVRWWVHRELASKPHEIQDAWLNLAEKRGSRDPLRRDELRTSLAPKDKVPTLDELAAVQKEDPDKDDPEIIARITPETAIGVAQALQALEEQDDVPSEALQAFLADEAAEDVPGETPAGEEDIRIHGSHQVAFDHIQPDVALVPIDAELMSTLRRAQSDGSLQDGRIRPPVLIGTKLWTVLQVKRNLDTGVEHALAQRVWELDQLQQFAQVQNQTPRIVSLWHWQGEVEAKTRQKDDYTGLRVQSDGQDVFVIGEEKICYVCHPAQADNAARPKPAPSLGISAAEGNAPARSAAAQTSETLVLVDGMGEQHQPYEAREGQPEVIVSGKTLALLKALTERANTLYDLDYSYTEYLESLLEQKAEQMGLELEALV